MFACRDEMYCCHGYCLPGYRRCMYAGVEMNSRQGGSAGGRVAGTVSCGDPLMSATLSQCRMVSQLLNQRPHIMRPCVTQQRMACVLPKVALSVCIRWCTLCGFT